MLNISATGLTRFSKLKFNTGLETDKLIFDVSIILSTLLYRDVNPPY